MITLIMFGNAYFVFSYQTRGVVHKLRLLKREGVKISRNVYLNLITVLKPVNKPNMRCVT